MSTSIVTSFLKGLPWVLGMVLFTVVIGCFAFLWFKAFLAIIGILLFVALCILVGNTQ